MHVIVTGASAGIGEAIARAFAAAGAKLTLVARRADRLAALAGELGVETHVVGRDLSDPEQATDWLPAAEASLGPPDVLVNNAGMQIIGPTAAADPDRGEQLLRLNVFAPFRLTRAVLPGMLERRRGTIVDIASMAALAPTPGMYYYNASKGALAAASEALRGELRGTGVHVVTVYPGIIPTDMGAAGLVKYKASAALKLQPQGTTTKLAVLVREAVEKRRARVIYPRLNVLARHLPATTRWFMDRFTPALADEN